MLEPLVVMESMTFGKKLEKLLELRDVSQAWLARRVGTYAPRVNEWIAGKGAPSLKVALEISRALDVPLEYLADDDQDSPIEPELTVDERVILHVIRDANLSRSEAIALLMGRLPERQAPYGPAIGHRERTEFFEQQVHEATRPVKIDHRSHSKRRPNDPKNDEVKISKTVIIPPDVPAKKTKGA